MNIYHLSRQIQANSSQDTTFERIANNFRTVHKIPDDKQITLMWDGDALEPSDVVRDTEIEDMESIEVHIK